MTSTATNAKAITRAHLRELYRADPRSHWHYLEREARRRIEREDAEAGLPPEEAYRRSELSAKVEAALEERLEALRTRESAADRGRYLSSSHSCPQTVSIEEIAAISPELAADIEEHFGDGATLELVGDAVHVTPAGVEKSLGVVQVDGDDTNFDEISANVEFRHGGSRIKASRHRVTDRILKGPEHGGGVRGTITGFSREARKRLMDFVAELRRDERPYFVTLTYPDDFPDDPEEWKNDLHKLLRRLSRRVERASVIWRLELVDRKSGQNRGKLAPHYHLLVYNTLDFDLAGFVEEHWHDIAGNESADHRWVHSKERGEACTMMQSWRHCAAYTAKELAKTAQALFDTYTIEPDRVAVKRAGRRSFVVSEVTGNVLAVCESEEEAKRVESWRVFVRHDETGQIEATFDGPGALERAEEFVARRQPYPDGVGRFWGAWGREYLPTVPVLVVWTLDAAAERMLRIMEEHAGVADYPYHKTMSVMCEASTWLRIFSRLLTGETDAESFRVVAEALP